MATNSLCWYAGTRLATKMRRGGTHLATNRSCWNPLGYQLAFLMPARLPPNGFCWDPLGYQLALLGATGLPIGTTGTHWATKISQLGPTWPQICLTWLQTCAVLGPTWLPVVPAGNCWATNWPYWDPLGYQLAFLMPARLPNGFCWDPLSY